MLWRAFYVAWTVAVVVPLIAVAAVPVIALAALEAADEWLYRKSKETPCKP